ncbi:unnamed protein product [Mytilus edulis]|uniref:Uncharacterized protein n=1 Tax=Mytilus edulis TaxID=6550 RepID=A0A8S3PRP0_MYTED|nr:unnamed protein product [Mytilus edulis]
MQIGTTTREDGGRCLPCKYNMYGVLCSETCDCNPYESSIDVNYLFSESTVSVKFLNETVTGKQTNTLKDRSSIKEWIMYTLCISGLTALTVVVHLLHKKRKQRSLKLKINEEVVLESFQPTPCIGIYSEFDENPLIFDTTELNVASQASFRKSNSCQENSNACEVIVTVHQCSENSSPLEKEATSNIYPDMFQPIQTDKQIQRQANKNLLSSKITKVNEPALQEANQSVYKTCNLQDCTNKFVKSEKTIDSVCVIDSNEDNSLDVEKSKTL